MPPFSTSTTRPSHTEGSRDRITGCCGSMKPWFSNPFDCPSGLETGDALITVSMIGSTSPLTGSTTGSTSIGAPVSGR